MTEGDIVLARLPQDDGQLKTRPVILLRELPGYGDFLACGLTTQLKYRHKNFDDIISSTDDDFSQSGLSTSSLVRLNFLSGLSKNAVLGRIGKISKARHKRLLKMLSDYLVKLAE